MLIELSSRLVLSAKWSIMIMSVITCKVHFSAVICIYKQWSLFDTECWFIHSFQIFFIPSTTLHWRHNDHDGASNHQPLGCLFNRLYRRRSKKTSKFRVTGTQPGSLHTAVQRKYTQPCSLFSRGTAVWTMGARLCQQWGMAVCKCPAV